MSATTPGPRTAAGTNAPQAAPASRPVDEGDGAFLPDFCAPSAVLAIVLLAALLGFVLALARTSTGGAFWLDLARTSAMLLPGGGVKISRREVKSLLLTGALVVSSNRLVRRLVERVRRRPFELALGTR